MSAGQPLSAKSFKDAVICLVTSKWNPKAKDQDPLNLIILRRGKTLKLGRNKECDVVVNDPLVSHVHFELTHDSVNDDIIIKDYSKRGTYVNEVNLRKSTAMVQAGDKIRVERFNWTLTSASDIEVLVKSINGGKVKNSMVISKEMEAGSKKVVKGEGSLEEHYSIEENLTDSPKPRGGLIATPLVKLRNMFSPRRSSSAVGGRKEEKNEVEDMNASLSESMASTTEEKTERERGLRSPRFLRRQNSMSSDLEVELQHNAKRQPAGKNVVQHNVVITSTTTTITKDNVGSGADAKATNAGSSSNSKGAVTRSGSAGVIRDEEGSAASLVVSSNKKIRDIYSTVLEAHSNKDVPTLENLTTDTIHSVIKCAADANEGFQNNLNAVMEKTSGLTSQFSEASALYDAVAQGKAFPFASSRILKERVRYCAQLEARLKEHQTVYESLLKSRDMMAKKLESVRISCGVARSIVAEYQRLYDSVYARINSEIPRPALDREAPSSLKLQRIVLTPEEVKEITRAACLAPEGLDEELTTLLGGAPASPAK